MSAVLPSGQTIAGYRIDGVIGGGGMGIVYRATQLSLGREVALKILAPHLSADPEFRERFRREAMLQAALEHPAIVTVYETGGSEDGLFLAMRLVDGTDLKRLVEEGPLAPERALGLLEQVAGALDAAHQAGLVHRDVKPHNVLVDADDSAFLADFGLTKGAGDRGLTLNGAYLGSLDYVAPEQIRGESFGVAGDVYAFTAMLYEAVVGEVPFPRETEAALLFAHVNEPAPAPSAQRPGLPPALDAVVARGLAKQPGERYSSAGQLLREARRALALGGTPEPRPFGETIVDPAPLRHAPVIASDPSRRVSVLALGVVAAACLGVAAAGFLLGHEPRGPKPSPAGVAVAGPLQVSFPSRSWQPARPQALPGLELANSVTLQSTDPRHPGSLTAGAAPPASTSRLLPEAIVGSTPAVPVRLGQYEALRFAGLKPHGVGDVVASVYVLQTGSGPEAIECVAPAGAPAAETLARCESIAVTAVVQGVDARPLGADPAYAAALRKALGPLVRARAGGRRALARGKGAGAERIANAFATAAATVAALTSGADERPARERLLRALTNAQSGYLSLGAALQAQRRTQALAAESRIRSAERAVDAALASLRPLGYLPKK